MCIGKICISIEIICSITTKNDRRIKLDNYKDYSHYLEKINEYIAEKMKRESKLLNKDNYKEYFSNAREFFINYNNDEKFYKWSDKC